MRCPKCKTVELKQSGYNSPHFCHECKGMWLANNSNLPDLTVEIDDTDSITGNDNKTGLCPAGHSVMTRAKVDIDEPFYLEKCVACGGIWFDQGEWQRISEHNLADHLSMLWSKSWQRDQSRAKSRKSFLEANQKLLGDQIVKEILELSEKLSEHPEKARAIAFLQQEIVQLATNKKRAIQP